MNALRLYGLLAAASLRARMQYKMDFIVNTLLYGMLTVSDFLMLAAIMLRFKEVGGWNIYEVGLLYGMSWIAMALYRTFAAELHNFDRYIVHGEFDGLLVRPWPTLLTLLGRNFEPHRLGAALQGAMILAIAVNHLTKTGALHSLGVAYIVAASFFGALIPFGLSLLTATLAFWVVRTGELHPFTIYAPMTASQYPLTVYPKWLRWLLSSILPVAFVNYVPVQYLLGKGGSVGSLVAAPAFGVVFATVAYIFWRTGERHYHSTGS